MPKKSSKQKEQPRKTLCQNDIKRIPSMLKPSRIWDVNPMSFQSTEDMPIEMVKWNRVTRRYEVVGDNCTNKKRKRCRGITMDDVIIQSYVVVFLYRIEMGWGKPRFVKALSIWGGKSAKIDNEDQIFPLENLWKDEIKEYVSAKKLGKTTLNHVDNFYDFPFYPCSSGDRHCRRSNSYSNQVHILAEQALIQMALYLNEHESGDYAVLASTIINYALQETTDDPVVSYLGDSLLKSAQKESECFPTTALVDIIAERREFAFAANNEAEKRKKPEVECKSRIRKYPKCNMNKFYLFSCAVRQGVEKDHPKAGNEKIARVILDQFKNLSDKEMEKWEKIEEEDKERYKREMAELPWRKNPEDPNAPRFRVIITVVL